MNLTGLRKELEQIKGLGRITIDRIISHLQTKGFHNIAIGDSKWNTDHLPPHKENVIVQCEVRRTDGTIRYYQCMACYLYDKQEEISSNWEGAVYVEEEDCYYAPAGWYEVTMNSDEFMYCAIGDFVTAWSEMPSKYTRPLN